MTFVQFQFALQFFQDRVFPSQVVLVSGARTVVTFTSGTDLFGTGLQQVLVTLSGSTVEELVSAVTQTEDSKVHVFQVGGATVGQEVLEVDSTVWEVTFTISRHKERHHTAIRQIIQSFEVEVLDIGTHNIQTKLSGQLLGKLLGIVFSSTSLRSVEHNVVLAMLIDNFSNITRGCRNSCSTVLLRKQQLADKRLDGLPLQVENHN